jgi:hypothetical protein
MYRGLTTCEIAAALLLWAGALPCAAQTAMGEIEGRPAPIALRRCIAGANLGALCNEDADCPGSSCVDRNVINLSVAVHYNAGPGDLAAIRNMLSAASAVMFDATDGQAQIGSATIHNNAFGTDADVRVYPTVSSTWWTTDTGNWKVGGSSHVSIDNILSAPAPGESLGHELTHLIFDARDEYEERSPGCGPVVGSASCPHASAVAGGETACLMDQGGIAAGGPHDEYCWGQGDPSDVTDISSGNHDPSDITEQSSCRANRSCWDQVVWSFPNTIKKPAGAPDPGSNGLVIKPTQFITTSVTSRVVLVLDESGSMGLESPARIDRLKVAAKDFVQLAETNTELGIVSFSDDAASASGRVNVAIAPLGATRTAWTNAIDGMAPFASTNIGSGLQKASDMIAAAGGVTANTFIVLMTDGLNNQPQPQATADADLQAKINALMGIGVPVYVTCTGSDLGLQSQCAEIASGTGGFYVDSASGGELPASFVELSELVSRRQGINQQAGNLKSFATKTVWVEKGSESATFTLVWDASQASAAMSVISPAGTTYRGTSIPQGMYVRVTNPPEGNWTVRVDPGALDSPYHFRAYSRNQHQSMSVGLRRPHVLPKEPLYVYAYPRSYGGAISHPSQSIKAVVRRPDGSLDTILLFDAGRANGAPDDIGDDGTFSGVYPATDLKGAYTFTIMLDAQDWPQSGDMPMAKRDPSLKSPRLVRQIQISGAVSDPSDIETTPEDGFGACPNGCERKTRCAPGKFAWREACEKICPNGTAAEGGRCLVPVDASGRANCVNTEPTNCPPNTSVSMDCRVYNLEARDAKGNLCKDPTGKPLCDTKTCTPAGTLPGRSLKSGSLTRAALPIGVFAFAAVLALGARRRRRS